MKLIIFIGAPASGKSTIAKKISQCTEIFLASKDDFKIEIFERCGFSSNAEKKFLGEIAENNFYNFVSKFIDENKNLIVEGCFKNLDILCEFATKNFVTYWIIFRADPEILTVQYNERLKNSERHPALSIVNCYPFVDGVSKIQAPITVEFADKYQKNLPKPASGKILTVDTTDENFSAICEEIINFCELERRI